MLDFFSIVCLKGRRGGWEGRKEGEVGRVEKQIDEMKTPKSATPYTSPTDSNKR